VRLLSEKEILEKLLIDERETLKRLVEKSEKILRVDKKTGDTVIIAPRSKLTDRQLISIILLGRYFSNKLNLVPSEVMTIDEIAQKLNLDKDVVSARLSDLKRERIVEMVSRGEYRISHANADTMLDEISEKIGE